MSKNLFLFIGLLSMSIALTSCDQCRGILGGEKIECDNGGSCNDGTCDCLRGYYGDRCELIDICELQEVYCYRGDCVDGGCICDPGYEGEDCSIETRKKFFGIYNVVEECADLDTTWGYNIEIEANLLDGSSMYIYNLFSYSNFPINGYFSKVEATVIPGEDNFKIPSQSPDDGTKRISGTGSITVIDENTTNIRIDYTTTNGNKSYNCVLEGVLIGQ